MELLENYFAELIQCVDACYLVIGIILVFLRVPDTADYGSPDKPGGLSI